MEMAIDLKNMTPPPPQRATGNQLELRDNVIFNDCALTKTEIVLHCTYSSTRLNQIFVQLNQETTARCFKLEQISQ